MLGLVENLGLHGALLDGAKIYVGVLAATILFIATNAGVIGASRITYSMASYRQLPGGLPPAAPALQDAVARADRLRRRRSRSLVLLPGQGDFLGTMYSFGAMLSFTIAHASVIALRCSRRDEELVYRARPNLRIRGVDWPLFAVLGGAAAGGRLARRGRAGGPDALGRPRLAGGRASSSTRSTGGASSRAAARDRRARRVVLGPALALEYRNILVPVVRSGATEEALDLAARLAAERGASRSSR